MRDEVVGPAGPTTATRMDKFTRMMLEQTGLISMIGKSERGPAAIDAIKDNKSAYLMAVVRHRTRRNIHHSLAMPIDNQVFAVSDFSDRGT